MAVRKKKALAKKKGSKSKAMVSMADWEKEMEEAATAESARVKGGGSSFLGIKNKEFTYQGADLGEEVEVVVLNFAYNNEYYDTPYNKDNPSPPACFAIDKDLDQMEPVDSSPDKQSDGYCAECELNQWGSAETGRGKACTNRRRLALIAAADLEKPVEDIEVVMLRTPPTSNKNFDKFWRGVAKVHRRPAYGLVTKIAFDEDSDSEMLTFEAIEKIDNGEMMAKIMQKREECEDSLMASPDFSGYGAVEKPAKKKRAKKKGRKSKFS